MKTKKKTVSRRQYLRIKARLAHCRLNYNGEIERTDELREIISRKDREFVDVWKERSAAVARNKILTEDLSVAEHRILMQSRELCKLRAEKEDLMAGIRGLNIVLTQLRQQVNPQAALLQPGQNPTAKTEQCTEAMLPKKDIHTPNQPPFALPICA